jgi:hypothetical protein
MRIEEREYGRLCARVARFTSGASFVHPYPMAAGAEASTQTQNADTHPHRAAAVDGPELTNNRASCKEMYFIRLTNSRINPTAPVYPKMLILVVNPQSP